MAQATDLQKMTCPICRKVTTLPDGDLTTLPPNFFMDNLKELITKETDGDEDEVKVTASADREMVICSLEDCQGEAVMYCTNDQEYLCQTCTDEHAVHRFTRKHLTLTAEEAKSKVASSTKSHHPCGRHPDQMLDMYCKTCEEIICSECCKTEHSDHNLGTLRPFVKPCEERLDTIMKRIDKLLKCVNLARQTSQQQVNKAQHHIVSLKIQVTSTFTQIREKLAQQEKRLMSDIEKAATRVDKVASCTEDEQQLAEVNLESLRFLGQSLLTGDVYDQMSNLPKLEEAVEKRWRTEIPGLAWLDYNVTKINMSDVDHLTLTETSHTTVQLPCLGDDRNVTGAEFNMQCLGKAGEYDNMAIFAVGGIVSGLCQYKDVIMLVKLNDTSLYMYSDKGDLVRKHISVGMEGLRDLILMSLKPDNDKLVITARYPHSLCYIPIHRVGGKSVLGDTQQDKLNYEPWGLCLNVDNNLVVTDQSNRSLHVYNSAGDEINTIKLPSGVKPRYLSSDPSGGYIVTDGNSKQIIWIDEQGTEQRRHKDTACGVALH